jgi:hypothetical protein
MRCKTCWGDHNEPPMIVQDYVMHLRKASDGSYGHQTREKHREMARRLYSVMTAQAQRLALCLAGCMTPWPWEVVRRLGRIAWAEVRCWWHTFTRAYPRLPPSNPTRSST